MMRFQHVKHMKCIHLADMGLCPVQGNLSEASWTSDDVKAVWAWMNVQ